MSPLPPVQFRASLIAGGTSRLAAALDTIIAHRMVRIESDESAGTGCIIGDVTGVDDSEHYLIATAAHVLASKTPEASWCVFPPGSVDDSRSFEIQPGLHSHGMAQKILPHPREDIAATIVRHDAWPQIDRSRLPSLPVLESGRLLRPGTRVGWAGYPGLIKKKTNRPTPCYYEGLISCTVQLANNEIVYVADGRGHKGVSGGPVWTLLGPDESPTLVGVISQYWYGDSLQAHFSPGMTVIAPVNSLLASLGNVPPAPRTLRDQLLPDELLEAQPINPLVAFAARCAARVLPLLERQPQASTEMIKAAEQCVLASQFNRSEKFRAPAITSSAAYRLKPLAESALDSHNLIVNSVLAAAYHAAVAATWGGAFVVRTLKKADDSELEEARENYSAAVKITIEASIDALESAGVSRSMFLKALQTDRDLLQSKWADAPNHEFVYPEEFGEFWPDGAPPPFD